MADNQNVIDELIVRLTLDSKEYDKADKEIDKRVTQTEKKAKDTDAKRKKRDVDQIKRHKETLKSVKELALGLRNLALTVGGLLGVGSVTGVVGLITAFAGMETGLRRAAVGTAMSNREMQAWGATARRLGADADAGAQAIADLAREQRTFNLTGSGPTMQAFARMGINLGPDTNIADALGQAQQLYRGANPAQQQQYESGLTAMGVSPDLILMIKSSQDAQQAYTKSLRESTEEDRKSLDALYDTIAAVRNALTAFAGTIATAVQPYVAQFGQWASQAAIELGQFVSKVVAVGGGFDGLMKVLDAEAPNLAANLRAVGNALVGMGETALVITYGLRQLGAAVDALGSWIYRHLGGTAQQNVDDFGKWVKDAWKDAVQAALGNTPGGAQLTPGAAARINAGALTHGVATNTPSGAELTLGAAGNATGAKQGSGRADAPATKQEAVVQKLVIAGFPIDQAIAISENLRSENDTFDPRRVGYDGKHVGIAQWDANRGANFKKMFGHELAQGTLDEQIEFIAKDSYERKLANKSFKGKNGVSELAASFSTTFEAHGDLAETARRAQRAQQFANQYNGGATNNQSISIQTVNVQANTPQEFVGGIQRVSGVQNYTAAVR